MRATHRSLGIVIALLATAMAPGRAPAQGALSILGFGYPLGGQSARSLSSGTSLAGIDPQTTVNPAAIVLNARAQGYAQFEPEFRTASAGAITAKTTTSRFPLFMVSGRQGRATFALSFSAFMDRTWANTYADTQTVGTERLASTVVTSSVGGISDSRVAMAWSFTEKFHLGAAVHLFPGQNRVGVGRAFGDSSNAGSFQTSSSYTFSGTALSLGGVFSAGAHLILSGDVRLGGTMSMRSDDSSVVGSGRVPLRLGVSATFDGIPGAVLSGRVSRDRWTDLAGLGLATLGLNDATDVAVGTEITGPRIGANALLIRAGYRSRGLPFAYGTSPVSEKSASGGVGVPIFGGRTLIDLGVVRATRTSSNVSEKAWLLSVGVGIRP